MWWEVCCVLCCLSSYPPAAAVVVTTVEPDQKRSLLQGADQSLNHNLHVPLICNDNDNDTRQTCAHPVQFSSGGRAQAYVGVNRLDCHAA